MADDRKKLRCAIYTRKSTEEGLEKDFNSLDAQHEACAAFILSQSHEGWTQLADRYDDGGFSGGSMVRPALQRLLVDVAMGRVDVVVVYKIDRLTRSLADFAKIVETFDGADCSFVSVTQSFNTTSSMGRLTLNVLLSFAQFEREVAAERIRDKIAASKKRGMWMGGPVPLGYEVKERKLIVVSEEACTVRDIMQRYLRSDGVRSLVEELERDGIVGKRRIMRNGSIKGGTPFRRGALAHLLSNRIYLGLITHKGKSYAGKHDAIVDEELFNQVQEKLAAHQSGNGRARQAASVSILAGRITDRHGRAMPPCHTQNHGKRYRYYASVPRDGSKEAAIRFPAADLEQAVVATLVSHLRDANALAADLSRLGDEVRQRLFEAANERAEQLSNAQGTKLKQQLVLLDLRVSIGADTIEANIDLGQFGAGGHSNEHGSLLSSFIVPATVKWNGHEPRVKLEPPSGSIARPSDALLDLMSRAFEAREVLLAMTQGDVGVMAPRHRRHLERAAKLSYLAPDIVLAILDGQQPSHLSARKLVRAASLPLDWAAQRRMLLAE